MSNGSGKLGVHSLSCHCGTDWVKESVYSLGNHLVIKIKNLTYIFPLANKHRVLLHQSLILPARDLGTLALRYTTQEISIYSVAFTDIAPFSTTINQLSPFVLPRLHLSSCQRILYTNLQMRVEAEDPVL